MPLRDHFRPPVSKRSSWEGFHGGWPMRIVEELAPRLPGRLRGRAARASWQLLRDRRLHI